MKLYLDFDPCTECTTMMASLNSPEMLFNLESRSTESAKFLRHLTYNHDEILRSVIDDVPKQNHDPGFYG